MQESSETTNQLIEEDNHERADSYDFLPSTPEIAKQGAIDLAGVLKKADSKTKDAILSLPRLWGCFAGVTPEIALQDHDLNGMSTEVLSKIQSLVNTTSEGIIMATLQIPEYGNKKHLEVINLRSAKRVIDQYSQYFPPEARGNTKDWLLNNYAAWVDGSELINQVRYGLLSGFPIDAILDMQEYTSGRYKVLSGDLILPEEKLVFMRYDSTRAGENEKVEYSSIVEKAMSKITKLINVGQYDKSKQVTEKEKIKFFRVNNPHSQLYNFSYYGFNSSRDKNYISSLDSLYQDSGIMAVMELEKAA